MVYKEFKTAAIEGVVGGKGLVDFTYLAEGELLGKHKVRAFNLVTVRPGSEIGCHTHKGESEISYILDGKANIQIDGKEVEAEKGTLAYCASGHSHSIANYGDEPLKIIALVIFD